jgi:hypothetical protein
MKDISKNLERITALEKRQAYKSSTITIAIIDDVKDDALHVCSKNIIQFGKYDTSKFIDCDEWIPRKNN